MSEEPHENIKIYRSPKSGSLRFTGTADFVDGDGNLIETRTDFKLCGCGRTKEAPFCDGSHHEITDQA